MHTYICSTCGKQWPENYCPDCSHTITKDQHPGAATTPASASSGAPLRADCERTISHCPKCGNELGAGVTRCWTRGCDYVVPPSTRAVAAAESDRGAASGTAHSVKRSLHTDGRAPRRKPKPAPMLALAARFANAQVFTMGVIIVAAIGGAHLFLNMPLPNLRYALLIAGGAMAITFCVTLVGCYLGEEVAQHLPWVVGIGGIFVGGYIVHDSARFESRDINREPSPLAGMEIRAVEASWSFATTSSTYSRSQVISGSRLIWLRRDDGSLAVRRGFSTPIFSEPPGKLAIGGKNRNTRPSVSFVGAIPTTPTGRMRYFHEEGVAMDSTTSFWITVDNALDQDVLLCVDNFGPEKIGKREQRRVCVMTGRHRFVTLDANSKEAIESIYVENHTSSAANADTYLIYNLCGRNTYTSVLVDLD